MARSCQPGLVVASTIAGGRAATGARTAIGYRPRRMPSPVPVVRDDEAPPAPPAPADASIKVTVVVPVYNPGPFIQPAIDSMLAQTLSPESFEVVFVDDGSTDDTPARLDALAATHPHIRVIHTPNSGWAGRPRNIGTRAARGEYVQYLDQDDWMAPDALRRLYEMAVRNRSDIVIGKVASDFRPVPHHLFRHNVDVCTLRDAPLISSLTPHKMFRTAFLREHGIEFPEGRRRLEDQLFMVRAYFAAGRVSILADTVCYFYARRPDGGNSGSQSPDPALYFGNLREVLEVVVANTEPGPFRTELLGRFYRTGMIARLSEPWYLRQRESRRLPIFREIRELALDFIDDDVHASLGTFRRIRSTLLRQDRQPALVALAERLQRLRAEARLEALRWDGPRLVVRFKARLRFDRNGEPFQLVERHGRVIVDPPLLAGIVDAEVAVDEPRPWLRLECALRDRATGAEWRLPVKADVRVDEAPGADGGVRLRPWVRARARIDLDRALGGQPVEAGPFELGVRLFGPGIDRRGGVLAEAARRPLPAALSVRGSERVYVASVDDRAGVTLIAAPLTGDASDGPGVLLPVDGLAGGGTRDVEVVAEHGRRRVRLAGRVEAIADRPGLRIRLGAIPERPGIWTLSARVGDPNGPERAVGTLEVAEPLGTDRPPRSRSRLPLRDRLRDGRPRPGPPRLRSLARWLPRSMRLRIRALFR